VKILFLLTFLFSLEATAQQVLFCESVDRLGNPKNASSSFVVGEKGGYVKVLVKLKNIVNSELVVFDVYRLNENKESFESTLKMDVQPVLTWFYKEITFFKTGTYRIYVYDERDKLLGVGEVQINKK
jgi:hypothetical protein